MSEETILVVEDNEIQREGTALVLRREGFRVFPAAGGKEALALLSSGVAPDLVLLDMTMPPPDGWRIMAMREKAAGLASVPVVLLTGLGVAHEEWAATLGACALIRKPVETAELLAAVRRCLDECCG
jgi:CheY-like chemotaxis protein